MTKFTKHIHAAVGVTIKIEVTLAPPFVIVTPEPVATITKTTEDTNFLEHEHEMEESPDLSVSVTHQELIGQRFMLHSHYYFSSGISLTPPGTFVSNVGFTPPPFDDVLSKKEDFLFELQNDYYNFFRKTVKVKDNTLQLGNKNYNYAKYNWRSFIDYYIKNNWEAINAKFSNNGRLGLGR